MYYKTCPDCGANNDPGERCECTKSKPYNKGKAENLVDNNHQQRS